MASYTMTVKEMIEGYTQEERGLSHRDRIEKGRKSLLDFSYPLFDEKYRGVFETHLIREFYMVEIGFETDELFKFNLETWLNVHMPYFNQLFLSEQIKFDPLKNTSVDMQHTKDTTKQQDDTTDQTQNVVTDFDARTTGNSTSATDTTNTGTNKNVSTHRSDTDTDQTSSNSSFGRETTADTPQNRLRLQPEDDGHGVIEYASNIQEDKENASGTMNQSVNTHGETTSDTDTTDNGSSDTKQTMTQTNSEDTNQNLIGKQVLDRDINELEEYVQHREGKIGVQSYSKMLNEYRDTFLRIERDIFREMRKELFMLIY